MMLNKKQITTGLCAALLAACSSVKKTEPEPTVSPETVQNIEETPQEESNPDIQSRDLDAPQEEVEEEKDPLLSQGTIHFEFDSFVVDPQYKPVLEAFAKYLLAHPQAKLSIQGHTDNRGTAEYNLALGQKRADAIYRVLKTLGVAAHQMESVSFGEEHPVDPDDTKAAWKRNRRGELVLNHANEEIQ